VGRRPAHRRRIGPRRHVQVVADRAGVGDFVRGARVVGPPQRPQDFDQKIAIDSAKDMDMYMEWADPTFGGAFEFTSTLDVLNQFEAMQEKVVPTTGLAPAPISPL